MKHWAEVEDLGVNRGKDKDKERTPQMDATDRERQGGMWKKAVTRTFDWVE